MPLFRRNTEKKSKMCKRDSVTFKVKPPFFSFEGFPNLKNHAVTFAHFLIFFSVSSK